MSQDIPIIKGQSELEVWTKIEADMKQYGEVLDYTVQIEQGDNVVMLIIDIDPGGGFEGGYAFTTFSAPLKSQSDFKFAIHKEGLLDELGKFFGMQDVETGYTEFDKKVIVKTNDEEKVKKLFADAEVRQIFKKLENYKFQTTHHHNAETKTDDKYVELVIEDGISDPVALQAIYHSFVLAMVILEKL